MLAVMAAGSTDQTINLAVKGAESLVVVSPFGVASTVDVNAGRAVVAIEHGIPTYVRVPEDVTVRVLPGDYGTDLLRGKTVTTSGSGARASQVTSGEWETWYDRLRGTATTDPSSPFLDDTASFPAWVEVDCGGSTTLDTIVIACPPPWQAQGTLLDYDLQRWNGSSWVTIETVTEPTNTVAAIGSQDLFACQAESYFSGRCVFVLTFAPVAATKFRIYVRSATYGGSPDAATLAAGGQSGPHNICLRAIEGYHRAGLPAPKYGARIAA